jgi:hypothetical protein
MMMPDDLDAARFRLLVMAMLENELRRFPARNEFDRAGDMPVVIPGEGEHLATSPELSQ